MADVVRTNPVTGNTFIDGPRSWSYSPGEIRLRIPVENLKAFAVDSTIMRFEWRRGAEPTDEADARDAQCRAGWSDTGYGFAGFHFQSGVATWSCARSCE